MEIITQFFAITSALIFSYSLSNVGLLKKELNIALKNFKNGEITDFDRSEWGLFDPAILIYTFFYFTPDIETNHEFYQIEEVKDMYNEYRLFTKISLFSALILIVSIYIFVP